MTDFYKQKKALDELSSIYLKLDEISADTALAASKEADKKRGQLAAAGDKEGAAKKAKQAATLYKKQADKRLNRSEEVEKKTRLVTDKDRKNVKEFEAALKKANEKAKPYLKNESISNWRDDLREIVGTGGLGGDVEDLQSKKPNSEVVVKEKNVKNKVVIDPEVKLEDVEKAVGGKVISVEEGMTTAALEDNCPDCGEPRHEGECVAEESEKPTVEESILWDRIAVDLTRLGEMYGCKFKVEGYQRNPEEGERKERESAKKREAIPGQARRGMPPRGNKKREEFEKWYREHGPG